MGIPNSWMLHKRKSIYKWMMTRGPPSFGNLHFPTCDLFTARACRRSCCWFSFWRWCDWCLFSPCDGITSGHTTWCWSSCSGDTTNVFNAVPSNTQATTWHTFAWWWDKMLNRMPRRPKQSNRRNNDWIRSCSSTSRWFVWWQIGSDDFTTMDDYTRQSSTWKMTSLRMNCRLMRIKWASQMSQNALWSDAPLDKPPAAPPGWIDKLADEVEINRLLSMGRFAKERQTQTWSVWERSQRVSSVTGARRCTRSGVEKMDAQEPFRGSRICKWKAQWYIRMLQQQSVTPQTLIPLIYLKMLGDEPDEPCNSGSYKVTLASLDIKDAFLAGAPRQNHWGRTLWCTEYLVLRNLPGQRLGAKAWYWHFRNYASEVLSCCWCARSNLASGRCTVDGVHNTFMIHVDDLLFAGSHNFWINKFLPAMTFEVQRELQWAERCWQ